MNINSEKFINYNNLTNKNSGLIVIKKSCDNLHKHCQEICQVAKNQYHLITQEYLNNFFSVIKLSNHNSCLSQYSNKNSIIVKEFIIKCSEFLKIPNWDPIIINFTDEQTNIIINNQKNIENSSTFIEMAINNDTIIMNYGSRVNLINGLLAHPVKIKSFENIIMSMELFHFSKYLNKMIKSTFTNIDNIIIKYINTKKHELKLNINSDIGMKIINNFINKPQIIKNIYSVISSSLTHSHKLDIFNKSISSCDKDLMFLLLENKDIIPDINSINKLVEKCYMRPDGCTNSKMIAEIIDLLCEYGLIITKQIIMKLLDHGCYINNLEKHGIEVDSEILAKCANHSYYPYKFDIKPNVEILIKECSKHDNLNTIKKLKEFGGIYTTECLEEACGVNKNGKVIKYLINDCGVNVSDKCLEKFKEAYKIEALDVLMKKYKIQNPESHGTNLNQKKNVDLDPKSIMTVTPKDIKIDKNDELIEYEVKNKIMKFFELKKKSLKYLELYQIVLKYLISNKLVIGTYFIINEKLSNLLKINYCTIIHIDQLQNILTYFIDTKN